MSETKLIVLGNGFDLACGLNSRYADFFKERISDETSENLSKAWESFKNRFSNDQSIDALNANFATIFNIRENYRKGYQGSPFDVGTFVIPDADLITNIRKADLTFWDIILYCFQELGAPEAENLGLEEIDWKDIENRMLDFLQKSDEKKEKPDFQKMLTAATIPSVKLDKINWFCLHISTLLSDRHKTYEKKNFLQYVYDELVLFEKAFSVFLKGQLSTDRRYHENALDMLCKMTGEKDRPTLIDSQHKIMSFNYTEPLNGLDITNVHGTLKSGKIIFGIDQEKIEAGDDIFRFTKTFRQMTETPISKNNGDNILPRKEELREIVFFGHSLSPLDYSYFQTLFDYYNLYDSDVKLVFFYKIYEGTTSLDMELDLSKKISKMLREYALSIDNDKKGKNLMHKLLLEKRLNIEELPLFQIVSN